MQEAQLLQQNVLAANNIFKKKKRLHKQIYGGESTSLSSTYFHTFACMKSARNYATAVIPTTLFHVIPTTLFHGKIIDKNKACSEPSRIWAHRKKQQGFRFVLQRQANKDNTFSLKVTFRCRFFFHKPLLQLKINEAKLSQSFCDCTRY